MYEMQINMKELEQLASIVKRRSSAEVRRVVSETLGRAMAMTVTEAKRITQVGGGVFHHSSRLKYRASSFKSGRGRSRPGRLSRSLKVRHQIPNLYAEMITAPKVPYARIQAWGGVIKHPGSTKFQAWYGRKKDGGTGWIYAPRGTRRHKITIKPTHYPTLAYINAFAKIQKLMTRKARELCLPKVA